MILVRKLLQICNKDRFRQKQTSKWVILCSKFVHRLGKERRPESHVDAQIKMNRNGLIKDVKAS